MNPTLTADAPASADEAPARRTDRGVWVWPLAATTQLDVRMRNAIGRIELAERWVGADCGNLRPRP
jgi:hypothetical protein